MLGAQFCVRTVSGFGSLTDQTNTSRSISNSLSSSSSHSWFHLVLPTKRSRRPKSLLISCQSSRASFGGNSTNDDEPDHHYLQAFLLLSETVRHYRMRRQGFQEERVKWESGGQLFRFSAAAKDPRAVANRIGHEFLRRFQNPTFFLRISCDGDFLLPIVVGEIAVERLIDAALEDENGDSPSQFQLVRNLVGKLGYEVKMVRITERVVNTYFARIYFGKPGEEATLSVDARPSDAINVATRCKVPIYVNKQIVLTDAVRIVYGMGPTSRVHDTKSIYDVNLDSPVDGPDILAEELDLLWNMNLAVKEERYKDAAMCRDKLMKLRNLRQGH